MNPDSRDPSALPTQWQGFTFQPRRASFEFSVVFGSFEIGWKDTKKGRNFGTLRFWCLGRVGLDSGS